MSCACPAANIKFSFGGGGGGSPFGEGGSPFGGGGGSPFGGGGGEDEGGGMPAESQLHKVRRRILAVQLSSHAPHFDAMPPPPRRWRTPCSPDAPDVPDTLPRSRWPHAQVKLVKPKGSGFGLKADRQNTVIGVTAGGAAEKAGLRVGDVVWKVDGEPIPQGTRLAQLIDVSAPRRRRPHSALPSTPDRLLHKRA